MANKDVTVYLVRHGATKLNATTNNSVDRIRGHEDVPLSEEGVEEANKVGKQLKGKNIKYIYCSDLSRAKETAKIIGGYLKLTPKSTFGLRPWDLGEFTGKSTKESLPKIEKYIDAPDKVVPKGESFTSFKDRALNELDKIIDSHPGDCICIVTHHRVERLAKAVDYKFHTDAEVNKNNFMEKGEMPGAFEKITMNPSSNEGALRSTIRKSVQSTKKGLN